MPNMAAMQTMVVGMIQPRSDRSAESPSNPWPGKSVTGSREGSGALRGVLTSTTPPPPPPPSTTKIPLVVVVVVVVVVEGSATTGSVRFKELWSTAGNRVLISLESVEENAVVVVVVVSSLVVVVAVVVVNDADADGVCEECVEVRPSQ